MTTKAEPSASMVPPLITTGTLVILAILGVFGIITVILIAISPVFQMMAYVIISAAVVYFIANIPGVKKKIKLLHLLSSFFAILLLLIVCPIFMSFFPPTSHAVTGEAALAQATAGEGGTQSQAFLILMPLMGAGTIAGIGAGRAKTTVQLIILSFVAVILSVFIVFALLIM